MSPKEDARLCQRCSHRWFAVRSAKAPKPRWYDDGATPWGSGAARVARLQGKYERSLVDRDRWSRCPNCGSTKVKTVSQRNFVPSGAETAAPVTVSPKQAPTPGVQPSPQGGERENPAWTAIKGFMRVHWRIVFAVFCTVGVVAGPAGGETIGDKLGSGLGFLAAAIVFWTLHARHVGWSRRSSPPAAEVTRTNELDMRIDDGWSRRLSSCRTKASVFNEVGTASPSEAVRSWLSTISDDIDAQLVMANDLAVLGRSIEPGFAGHEPTNSAAHEAWSRLEVFEAGLADTVTAAAKIRLNSLTPEVKLDAIHTQLQMLRAQLPTLDPSQ